MTASFHRQHHERRNTLPPYVFDSLNPGEGAMERDLQKGLPDYCFQLSGGKGYPDSRMMKAISLHAERYIIVTMDAKGVPLDTTPGIMENTAQSALS